MNRCIDLVVQRRSLVGLVLLLAMALLTGCGVTTQQSQYVEAFDNGREKMALDAYDVVLSMRRAGFDDEQILEHGPALRNALAQQGGARVRGGQFTRAMFMAHDGELYAVSQKRGTFRYNPERAAMEESVQYAEQATSDDAP